MRRAAPSASARCSERAVASHTTPATELPDSSGTAIAGTGIHTVTVAWQGVSRGATAQPLNLCGKNLYPSEDQRRIVTATLRIGALRAQ